jgi:GNAT superfamily N-acetyltransferase
MTAAGLVVERVVDAAGARRWHDVDAATRQADYVALPPVPVEDLLPLLAGEVAGELTELWLGLAEGTPVAASRIIVPLHGNTVTAMVDIRVIPASRRQGHGRQMLAHVLDRVRSHGRSRVFAEASGHVDETGAALPSAGLAFAAATGARPALAEVRSLLQVGETGTERLAVLRAEAVSSAAGYSLVQWADWAPADVAADVSLLLKRMSTDAPMGELQLENEVWDAGRYLAQEEMWRAQGRRHIATAARHDATGQVVGYTDMGVHRADPMVAFQWNTIVDPVHRGHRLGLLLKIANLNLLRETMPSVRVISTWNAVVNRHMIAINETIGFRPVDRWTQWQLDLPE